MSVMKQMYHGAKYMSTGRIACREIPYLLRDDVSHGGVGGERTAPGRAIPGVGRSVERWGNGMAHKGA